MPSFKSTMNKWERYKQFVKEYRTANAGKCILSYAILEFESREEARKNSIKK